MKRRVGVVVTIAVVGALAYAAPGITKPGNKYDPVSDPKACGDGTVTFEGPAKLWPPNHKQQPIAIVWTDDDDAMETLATEGSHEEFVDGQEMPGSGNTSDDVSPAVDSDTGTRRAETNHLLRAERSGQGDGRTYTIMYEVTNVEDDSTVCMGSFTVDVPHDMRGGAGWK